MAWNFGLAATLRLCVQQFAEVGKWVAPCLCETLARRVDVVPNRALRGGLLSAIRRPPEHPENPGSSMSVHQIKRGLDIPIAGAANGAAVEIPTPATVAYAPTEFRGVVPKLAKREGDAVKAGEPLFFDKYSPEMVFLSPASGVVKEIRRGRRRVITHIIVEVAGEESIAFTQHSQADLEAMSEEAARALLLATSGVPVQPCEVGDAFRDGVVAGTRGSWRGTTGRPRCLRPEP